MIVRNKRIIIGVVGLGLAVLSGVLQYNSPIFSFLSGLLISYSLFTVNPDVPPPPPPPKNENDKG